MSNKKLIIFWLSTLSKMCFKEQAVKYFCRMSCWFRQVYASLDSRLWADNQTPTLGLIVWHNDCVLKDDLREIVNSSNKRCTTVYRQSFSRKINCTKVKQTATKLHKSPDETDEARVRVSFKWETPTPGQHSDSGGLRLRPHTTGWQTVFLKKLKAKKRRITIFVNNLRLLRLRQTAQPTFVRYDIYNERPVT